jgi:hypothetical protein
MPSQAAQFDASLAAVRLGYGARPRLPPVGGTVNPPRDGRIVFSHAAFLVLAGGICKALDILQHASRQAVKAKIVVFYNDSA